MPTPVALPPPSSSAALSLALSLALLVAAACGGTDTTSSSPTAGETTPTPTAATVGEANVPDPTPTASADSAVDTDAEEPDDPDAPVGSDDPATPEGNDPPGPVAGGIDSDPATDDGAPVVPTPAAPTVPTPRPDDPIVDPTPANVGTDGDCVAEQPIGPVNLTTATLDWDGDGGVDILTVYGLGQVDSPRWRIRVDTATGQSMDSPLLVDSGTGASVRAIGGADVDGDGSTDEAFAVTGRGVAASIVTVLTRDGCQIVAATLDGAPIGFPIGGSEFNIAGLSCADTDDNGVNNSVWAWLGFSDDGVNWRINGVQYELRGTNFAMVSTDAFEANTTEPDFAYPFLLCDEVNYI